MSESEAAHAFSVLRMRIAVKVTWQLYHGVFSFHVEKQIYKLAQIQALDGMKKETAYLSSQYLYVPPGGEGTSPGFVRGCAHEMKIFHPAPEFLPSNDTLF